MRRFISTIRPAGSLATLLACVAPSTAQTPLADQALFASITVPGNLALALSVEFPTAVTSAYRDIATYASASTYIGYFDPNKCYAYKYDTDDTKRYFYPTSVTADHLCTGKWSGNFLNWATMQTIDPFRWALTGGYRSTDTPTETILEKAWAPSNPKQGDLGSNFPDRTLSSGVKSSTPFDWPRFKMRVLYANNKLRFTQDATVADASTPYDPNKPLDSNTVYDVHVRVKVCDPAFLETNCTQYGSGNAIVYKPTGLMQKYSNQIRYSAFGYLNDGDLKRDGGVLRAAQKFIGPTQPVVGSNVAANNGAAEWSASTGVMPPDPDSQDSSNTASASGFNTPIINSGVMNYLNKFGSTGSYKTYDPVSELYYATLRYFKNQGNVTEWSTPKNANDATRKTWADGFPVITQWKDPIQYSCQKNFVLGIGDANTHADRNLPSATGSSEPNQPSAVYADDTVDSVLWTNRVGALSGLGNLGNTQNYNGCCNNNGALMAGLAYYANTQDIRPDLTGTQSVQTYWLDVLEGGYKTNNQFYLATKFGGFTVPSTFMAETAKAADIPLTSWHTGPSTDITPSGNQLRPDNYFTAARADLMVAGLSNAFASIAKKMQAASTGFVTASPVVNAGGNISYASRYDTSDWSGDVLANEAVVNNDRTAVTSTFKWSFSTALAAQAAGDGWNTGRFIATYNTAQKTGVAFRHDNLGKDQKEALVTSYRGADGKDYLEYLRGDRKNEKSRDAGARAYRDRTSLVGDIVDAKLVVVGPPASGLATAANPGYGAFKSDYAKRSTMVYAATNRGMLHAIDGSSSSTGKEVFAYVPGAVYTGPTGTPVTNGLQAIGNPTFVHYNFVNATPVYADIDMGRTGGASGASDWRTVLVGGLGKGGRSIYALDITDPVGTVTDEAKAASKVLWEFTDTDLGYTYGQPTILKTRAYGWVVVIGSGYNNGDGKGYFFILNAKTGALIKKLGTGMGSSSEPAGLAQVQGFVLDLTDGTADSLYAGDLLGNVWRVDVTATDGNYPAPLHLAQLKDSGGNVLPITSRVTPVVQPGTNRRFVTVGTGRLLHANDISNTQGQTLFAIIDGTAARFGKSSTLPSGVSYPILRANLKQLTDLQKGAAVNLATQVGWYLDLGAISAGPGWRVISEPVAFYGIVAFNTVAPTSKDVCQPGGNSRAYSIDLGTGISALPSKKDYLDFPAVLTDLSFYSIGGTSYIVPTVCERADNCKSPAVKVEAASGLGVRRLNWREIPQTN